MGRTLIQVHLHLLLKCVLARCMMVHAVNLREVGFVHLLTQGTIQRGDQLRRHGFEREGVFLSMHRRSRAGSLQQVKL